MVPLLLPPIRNEKKDTKDFMALMNTKVEMVWRALPYVQTPHIAWIDAGIFKIMKDIPRVQRAFEIHKTFPWPNRVMIPGCWKTSLIDLYSSVSWRFCGGFFVAPVSFVPSFYEKVSRLLDDWISLRQLAWEVNLWADLETKEPDLFAWFPADHNETMLEPQLLQN
jgi:hypothetical protein